MDTRVRTAVKTTRQRLDMQQRDLAKAVGVSRQTLSSIEAGETVPSTQIALALARELRCRGITRGRYPRSCWDWYRL